MRKRRSDFIDLAGKTFARLTAIEYSHTRNGISYYKCICTCGNTITVRKDSLLSGNTKSCGCFQTDSIVSRFTKHGQSAKAGGKGTPEYAAWNNIKNRCYNINHPEYVNYGGRGIIMCDRWRGINGFSNFFEDMGSRPYKHSIDRIDNDGIYDPKNCRWATSKQQGGNTRKNIWIECNGENMVALDWAKRIGISSGWMYKALKKGYSIQKIIDLKNKRAAKLNH